MARANKNLTLRDYFNSGKDYREMLESACENSPVGMIITDAEGLVLKVNSSHITVTGQKAEYNVGRNMYDIQYEDGSPSATVKVIETLKPQVLEQNLVNGNSYLVFSNPCFDENGKLKYVVSNLIDTTEINKTLEEVREDNKRLSLQLTELQNQMNPQNKIIHQSRVMRQLILLCEKVAQVDSTVLLQGESGVGKEKVAEYIFEKSSRNTKPFVKLNCASIPEQLLESELFGYEGGAFTGSNPKGKKGILDYVAGGILLLDEIGELPMTMQAKLLRLLQTGDFYRVGGREPIVANVRIIAATNRNLLGMVHNNLFREDLYHRLNVIPVYVPPLRDRKEDIPLLLGHFTRIFNQKYSLSKSWEMDAIKLMMKLHYPGNVRELQNTIERILVLTDNNIISKSDVVCFYEEIGEESRQDNERSLSELVTLYEKKIIKEYLNKLGTEEKVSKALGVSQSTISRKLNK